MSIKTHNAELFITKEQDERYRKYLQVEPQSEEESLKEDETIINSVTFKDGYVMDIKICGVQFMDENRGSSNNNAYSEAVLFDANGIERACTDVSDEYTGLWELTDNTKTGNGNTYKVDIRIK